MTTSSSIRAQHRDSVTGTPAHRIGGDRRPRVLLISGWQTVNIGDVAHTPGALRVLERHVPQAEVRLLARSLDAREYAMLRRDFPAVEIVQARLEEPAERAAVDEAFAWADLLLHGSGPSVVAVAELDHWRLTTDKPYGVFGVTVDPLVPFSGTLPQVRAMVDALPSGMLTGRLRSVLDAASFVFCRDSLSAQFLQRQELQCPVVEFGPDATIAFDRSDDTAAATTLDAYGLVPGRFFCVVPRLRFTPYFKIRVFEPGPDEHRREAVNAAFTASDLGVLRDAVVDALRRTDHTAFVVPEMSYQMELAAQWFAPGMLPADVADRVVVLPRFWDLAEAAGVYAESAAVLSMECHSPLIAAAASRPTAYLRQPTDTIKGQMHPDLGIATFDVEPSVTADVSQWLTDALSDPAGALATASEISVDADRRLARMGRAVADALRLTSPVVTDA